MRKIASRFDDVKLLNHFIMSALEFDEKMRLEVPIYEEKEVEVSRGRGKWKTVETIIKKQKIGMRERTKDEIPSLIADRFSGFYAEILHRMGKSEDEIGEILRKDEVLNYQKGEEQYFINIE